MAECQPNIVKFGLKALRINELVLPFPPTREHELLQEPPLTVCRPQLLQEKINLGILCLLSVPAIEK